MRLLSDEEVGLRPTGTLDLPEKGKLLSDRDVGLEREEVAGLPRQFSAGFNERIGDLMQAPSEIARPLLEPLAKMATEPLIHALGQRPPQGRIPMSSDPLVDLSRS